MNELNVFEGGKQYIRIEKPSKEDVEFLNVLFKKGRVYENDLRANMSFMIPYHGQENPDTK